MIARLFTAFALVVGLASGGTQAGASPAEVQAASAGLTEGLVEAALAAFGAPADLSLCAPAEKTQLRKALVRLQSTGPAPPTVLLRADRARE